MCTLIILRKGHCEGEMDDKSLNLVNCEITILESVNILIWHPAEATKMAVKMAASSATDDEGNDAVMQLKMKSKERMVQFGVKPNPF